MLAGVCVLPITAYATGAWVNGQAATVVLGQPDFGSLNSPISAGFFDHVNGVAVDPTSGKVFVVDAGSNRVMRFTSAAALIIGSNAEAWFGQPNESVGSPNAGGAVSAKTFYIPEQIHVDASGTMWVADRENHRVLRFDNASSKASYANADGVLGQANFIASIDNRGGAVAANTMKQPSGVWNDGLGLWVADAGNNRVLGFSLPSSKANGAAADVVLGQPDFTHSGASLAAGRMNLPFGVVVSGGGTLYVADGGNARVIRFDGAALKANGSPEDGSLGGFGNPGAATMKSPYAVALDSTGRLYVSDSQNNRVLIFNDAAHKPDGAAADNVLGQPDFTSVGPGGNTRAFTSTTGLAFDNAGNTLWVGDYFNDRALRFSPAVGLLNVDASGISTKFDPLTDGLLIIRYLFGLTGTPLTSGALGLTATRKDPAALKAYLDDIRPALDVDNDGKADALTDGVLIIRYLSGLHGTLLTNGVIGAGATRNSAALIEPYILSLTQ